MTGRRRAPQNDCKGANLQNDGKGGAPQNDGKGREYLIPNQVLTSHPALGSLDEAVLASYTCAGGCTWTVKRQ